MGADHPSKRPIEDDDGAFHRHGDLLFSVAHSMLGDTKEAAEVIREVRERWLGEDGHRAPGSDTALIRLTTCLAIARLRTARNGDGPRIGPWLPDPLLDEPELSLAESISAAMTVVLDALQPEERTVFVLRHGFGLTDSDIASVTGRPERSVRRTGAHAEARLRCESVPADDGQVARRFVASCTELDRQGLCDVLAADVVLRPGENLAPPPVEGREDVADALLACFAEDPLRDWFHALDADGLAVVWTRDPSPLGAVVLRMADGGVKEVDLIGSRS
ncbi:sigma-70 family RNA polymerase sigma factor [Actinomadura viridis]|uniref:RNA polymerase sigma-70 factor (ECF subfamily) n=1 Tax=Actinomadura viridis TaxID=58110 RepID=A0A931DG21_9ACTN|nr:sigma factor-like helix-turn-helix DNA-binding protein [Actinomadura viridis]MBG6086896.1 RNA polymerase sigma-70 factor (ECF subfamily) [Actinomadura viridis]